MRIDIHTHPLWTWEDAALCSEEELLKQMDLAGIDKAVLLPIDTIPSQLDEALKEHSFLGNFKKAHDLYVQNDGEISFGRFKDKNRKMLEELDMSNERVCALCSAYPDKFIGFGSVNPSRSREEIEAYIDDFVKKGFKGLKLMPTLQFFNPQETRLDFIYQKATENGLAILFHTSCDPDAWEYAPLSEDANPKYLDRVAGKYKDLKIIAAHMGSYSYYRPGIWFEEMMKVMENNQNVFTDTSALFEDVLFGEYGLIEKAIKRVGTDRILFGSDYPIVMDYDMSAVAKTIDSSCIEGKKNIMGDNARILLGL